jgi:hypothetical protein
MGAATFAFFPTRRALIAEGASELLLLPRLMREATSSEGLEFQVVHGLANLNLSGFPSLANDPDNVVFIVDNDRGGRDLRGKLEKSGVSPAKIMSLRDVGNFITVEDLLDASIWKEAVNLYIDKYGSSCGITDHIGRVPIRNRIKTLPDAISKEKISIAYNVLDIVAADPSRQILASGARAGLAALVGRIRRDFAAQSE